MEAVSKFRCCLGERRQAELQERVQKAVKEAQEAEGGCADRDVTPVWKLSIVDANDMQSNCSESSGYCLHFRSSRTQFNLPCNFIF